VGLVTSDRGADVGGFRRKRDVDDDRERDEREERDDVEGDTRFTGGVSEPVSVSRMEPMVLSRLIPSSP
jgi:hypothetical protein